MMKKRYLFPHNIIHIRLFLAFFCISMFLPEAGNAYTETFFASNIGLYSDKASDEFLMAMTNMHLEAERIKNSISAMPAGKGFREKKLSIPSEREERLVERAILMIRDDDLDAASELLFSVTQTDPSYPKALYLQALISFQKGEFTKAVIFSSLLEKEYAHSGFDTEIYYIHALSLFNIGEYRDAWNRFIRLKDIFEEELNSSKYVLNSLKEKNFGSEIKQILAGGYAEGTEKGDLPDSLKGLLRTKWFLDAGRFYSLLSDLEKKADHEKKEKGESKKNAQNRIQANDQAKGMIRALKESTINALTKELYLRMSFMVEENEKRRSHIYMWSSYYISKSIYLEYLKDPQNRRLRIQALLANKNFLDAYRDKNNDIVKEVVYRLIRLNYDTDGFSNDIIELYSYITGMRFSNDPDTAHALYDLGIGYYNNRFFKKAYEVLKRLKKKFPNSTYSSDILYRLGEIELMNGNTVDALEYYKKASIYNYSYYSFASLYKSGFLMYRLFEFEECIATLTRLLDKIEKLTQEELERYREEDRKGLNEIIPAIVQASQRILALSLYENGGKDRLIRFIENNANAGYLPGLIVSFGNIFHIQKDYLSEISVYSLFLEKVSISDDTEKLISSLLKKYDYLKLRFEADKLRSIVIDFYNKTDDPDTRSILKKTVVDAYISSAEYHRLLAKDKDNYSEYEKSIALYRDFLRVFRNIDTAQKAHIALADILFEIKRFKEAGREYSDIAWGHHSIYNNQGKREAALKAVVSFHKVLSEGDVTGNYSRRFYMAADRFVKNYPDNEDTPKVTLLVAQQSYSEGRYKKAAEKFNLTLKMKPNKDIAIKAYEGLSQSYYHNKDYSLAEKSSRGLLTYLNNILFPVIRKSSDILFKVGKKYYTKDRYLEMKKRFNNLISKELEIDTKSELWDYLAKGSPIDTLNRLTLETFKGHLSDFNEADRDAIVFAKRLIAASVQKMTGQLIKKGRYREGAESYITCAILASSTPKRIGYLYKASLAYLKIKKYDRAEILLSYIEQNYLSSIEKTQRGNLLISLAAIYENRGKNRLMAYALKKAAEEKGIQPKKRLTIILKAAKVFEQAGMYDDAEGMYSYYLSSLGSSNEKAVEGYYKIGFIHEKRGDKKNAARYYKKAIYLSKRFAKNKEAAYYAANAHFNMIEISRQAYEKENRYRYKGIKEEISRRNKILTRLVKGYNKIIRYGIFELAAPSYYRIGSLYDGYARMIKDMPVPKGLTEDEKTKYRSLLAKRVSPIIKKAVQAYKMNIGFIASGRYNKWIDMSIKARALIDENFSYKREDILPMGGIGSLIIDRADNFETPILVTGFETIGSRMISPDRPPAETAKGEIGE